MFSIESGPEICPSGGNSQNCAKTSLQLTFVKKPYIMAGFAAIKERRVEACDNFSDKCGSHLRPCVCSTRRGQPLWTIPPPLTHWTELLSKCSADKQTICASWENKHDAGGNLLL